MLMKQLFSASMIKSFVFSSIFLVPLWGCLFPFFIFIYFLQIFNSIFCILTNLFGYGWTWMLHLTLVSWQKQRRMMWLVNWTKQKLCRSHKCHWEGKRSLISVQIFRKRKILVEGAYKISISHEFVYVCKINTLYTAWNLHTDMRLRDGHSIGRSHWTGCPFQFAFWKLSILFST